MIQIERKCGRCGRKDPLQLATAADVLASEELAKARAAFLEDLEGLLEDTSPELLPDLLVLRRGQKPIIHEHLCADAGKRACSRRVADLVASLDTLPPRAAKVAASDDDAA